MRIPRLYIDQSLTVGQQLQLPADAAHYVSKVLRLKTGRQVLLFNGQGGEYQAVLSSVDRRSVAIDVEAFVDVDRESPLRVELAIGISRGERMNWVIQKATELGVSAITPLFTERTEVKLDESRQASRLQHWLQVAISACEQSQRTRLPLISAPQPLSSFLDNCSAQRKLVLHPTAEEAGLDVSESVDTVCVLIGPEGGLSEAEVESSISQGFKPWQLGPRILRTETAPVVALSILQACWGDFALL